MNSKNTKYINYEYCYCIKHWKNGIRKQEARNCS